MKQIARRIDKLEDEIGKPEGCETCKEFDGIPALSDATQEQAMLNEYAAKVEKPEGAIQTVACKALCKGCRRPYIQIIHVQYVEGRK